MKALPTHKQFIQLFESVPARYKPLFQALSKGGLVGKLADVHKIPRITFQVVCYRTTAQLLGISIPPRLLQRLWLMRLLIDGDENEMELRNRFGSSAMRSCKVAAFDSYKYPKRFKFDVGNVKASKYRYVKLHTGWR